jgi:hypothetical protein
VPTSSKKPLETLFRDPKEAKNLPLQQTTKIFENH